MPNPHLIDGFDPITLTRHCSDCEEPLFNLNTVLRDHLLCTWSHYGYIGYPETYATDEKGKTLEGVIDKPARALITLIPRNSSVSFCLGCKPDWKTEGCGICGRRVDQLDPYSRVETIQKYTSGINRNFQVYYFHQECLPYSLFSDVHSYQAKYRP